MAKLIQLENTTRAILRFPVYRTVQRGKQKARRVPDRSKTLVLGDANDLRLPPGVERGPRCPSPVLVVTEEQIAALDPPVRAALEGYIRKGDVRRQEVSA